MALASYLEASSHEEECEMTKNATVKLFLNGIIFDEIHIYFEPKDFAYIKGRKESSQLIRGHLIEVCTSNTEDQNGSPISIEESQVKIGIKVD